METGTSIYGQVMKKIGIKLPTDPHCLINCSHVTIYQLLDRLWHTVNTSVEVYDENSKALEEFTKNVAEWAAEFQAQIIALVQGGGDSADPLGVIGWNSFTNELKDKLQKCLITGGRFEQDANGLMWLRLTTDHAINSTISIRIPDGMFGGGGGLPDLSALKFYANVEDCHLGPDQNSAEIILPYANGIEGGDDDLEPCAGIMRASQAKKLDNFDIVDDTLIFNGRKYVLQPFHAIVDTSYAGFVITSINAGIASSAEGSTTTLTPQYQQTKTVTYDDGSTEDTVITTGATIDRVEINSEYLDHIAGNVIYWKKNESTSQRSMTAKVTMTLNGETKSKDVTIKQNGAAAPAVDFYIGQADGTRAQFAELTSSALVAGAENKKITITSGTRQNDGSYLHSKTNEKIIYYVMYPVGKSELIGATLRTNVPTDFTADDINNAGSWNATHNNVTIDGIEYAVRGYRNTSLAGSIMDLYIKQK